MDGNPPLDQQSYQQAVSETQEVHNLFWWHRGVQQHFETNHVKYTKIKKKIRVEYLSFLYFVHLEKRVFICLKKRPHGVYVNIKCTDYSTFFCCCRNAYINNFRFKHSNVFKGDVIPFKAIISGTYYLDYLGTPELTYIEGTPQRNAVKTTSLKNDKLPVVCTGDTADMIVKQDGAAHKNLTIKLTKLAKEVLGNNATRVVELMKSWGPFIPIMSKYNCQPLNLEVSGDHGYTFKYMATFKEYKPIIFMDAMGMGMFNYKRSFVTKHTGHASGNPIRFCGGSAYTGDMFTVEPRPKCPLTSTKENRYHGHAVITVYKPNCE